MEAGNEVIAVRNTPCIINISLLELNCKRNKNKEHTFFHIASKKTLNIGGIYMNPVKIVTIP